MESLKMRLLDPGQRRNSCLDLWVDWFGCLLSAVGSGEQQQQQKNMIKLSVIIRVIKQEGLSVGLRKP